MSPVCCPLSGCDDTPNVYTYTYPVAAKDHQCEECCGVIFKGIKHELYKSLFDGKWSTTRTCTLCVEIRTRFQCGGYTVGSLWEDLEENFFPDMKAGGECMDGLSPAAKAKLFEVRMEWVFNQDEWQPEGSALPPKYQPQRPRASTGASGDHAENFHDGSGW